MKPLLHWLTPVLPTDSLVLWHRWMAGVAAAYLLVRARAMIATPPIWQPVGIFAGISEPLPGSLVLLVWLLAVAGLISVIRSPRRNVLGSAGMVALFLVVSHRSSGGQILWFDVLLALHALVAAISLAPWPREREAMVGGWAVRLAALMTVISYVVAGVAKIRMGGMAWLSEGALERHIGFSATRMELLGGDPSPFARWLLDLSAASTPLSFLVVTIELGAPIALLGRRAAIAWSVSAWLMHVTIALTMFVVFHWPLTGAAFVPLLLGPHLRSSSPEAETRVDGSAGGRNVRSDSR